ncbi:MAG TPA: acyltransferase [Spirochaetota bacterium]|nr:acyltransferase [Spirochaetota bacterium]HPJ33907.1 acyltransferase [Spirochaetota bacterium]
MLSFLPGKMKGVILIILFAINTVFWVTLLLIVSLFRIAVPLKFWYRFTSQISITIADSWITCNNAGLALMHKIEWDVQSSGKLEMNEWYLVVSNHQSWVDIVILQKVLLGKIPFLKFFLKKELIWVPVLGPAWWSLEFPFMKRYPKELLKKKPHLKGKDIEATRKACEKYKTMPVSVMNFMEGTRFTPGKHRAQKSPYINLLKPRAGGISLVMKTMGEQLNKIADVTIYYPEGPGSFWDLLCGNITKITVRINVIPVTDEIRGDYVNDEFFVKKFQEWLNSFWKRKDDFIENELKPERSQSRIA